MIKDYIFQKYKIKDISQQSLELVSKMIDGVELSRPILHKEFEDKLNLGRFIQITGLSGTGKSVLLRQITESNLTICHFYSLNQINLREVIIG